MDVKEEMVEGGFCEALGESCEAHALRSNTQELHLVTVTAALPARCKMQCFAAPAARMAWQQQCKASRPSSEQRRRPEEAAGGCSLCGRNNAHAPPRPLPFGYA